LRILAYEEGMRGGHMSLASLLIALETAGLLRPEQYQDLRTGMALRDAIAHGRRPDEACDTQLLHRLIGHVRDLAGAALPAPAGGPRANSKPHTRSATPATKS
jgi:hypothetical protein